MKINTFGELMAHLGYSAERPTCVKCIEMARLTEQFRTAWNFGHAIGQREAMDEYHAKRIKEIEDAEQSKAKGLTADAGLYVDSCTRECKRRLRS